MSEAVHNPFAGSDFETKKLRKENRVKGFMLLASLVLIVPSAQRAEQNENKK